MFAVLEKRQSKFFICGPWKNEYIQEENSEARFGVTLCIMEISFARPAILSSAKLSTVNSRYLGLVVQSIVKRSTR